MKSRLLFITFYFIVVQTILSQNIKFTFNNFEKEFLKFKPKNNGISDKDFKNDLITIKNIKSDVKNNPNNFNVADYLNVLHVFLSLKESRENILIAFEKLKNANSGCQYILYFEKQFKDIHYEIIRNEIENATNFCKGQKNNVANFDIVYYSKQNNLDINLVKLISKIKENDLKFRNKDNIEDRIKKQRVLDVKNQKSIDSLFQIHKSYLGVSMVGEKFQTVMWSVIQHSNVEMMEKYLPIIHKAYLKEDIFQYNLRMLIDRFYGLKYGYQIYGSQSGFGFDMANSTTRSKISKKYNIDYK
ncbi:hypothetical protein [Polaribacter porphyrae]|uniref:Uncharacterized protein n=1 Tax=Polaribacter porphyrae TaxID=1137780 RepID=A0A2S7WP86_9FLAO|nr:hypothetical protein [Polaribacter porphyrae]PQJ79091.1 hypothetical protein BTO18_07875 [Polaribacter porphyrae]